VKLAVWYCQNMQILMPHKCKNTFTQREQHSKHAVAVRKSLQASCA
jgi:hypothetical protein